MTTHSTNSAHNSSEAKRFHTAIIGGGPAGTGPLIYGAGEQQDLLAKWLDKGVAIVEKGDSLCAGRLINYRINSNSLGEQFLDFLNKAQGASVFKQASNCAQQHTIAEQGQTVVALQTVGQFLQQAGEDLQHLIASYSASQVLFGEQATGIRQTESGLFEVNLQRANQERSQILAENVLVATGGQSVASHSVGRKIISLCEQHRSGNRAGTLPMMTHSEALLTDAGRLSAELWLEDFDAPQVLIIGGSHSAFSAAWTLLNNLDEEFEFNDPDGDGGQIHMLHRGPMRVFYESRTQAEAEGYHAFGTQDICPVTGHVFEIAGLRGDARTLYRDIAGLSGAAQEHRVMLHQIDAENATMAALEALNIDWSAIELVVFANGYQLPAVSLTNPLGKTIPLLGEYTGRYVDDKCRVLDTKGSAIPGLYAMGMATGYLPTKLSTGEPSFNGKDNSVWLCQNDLGALLFNTLSAN